MRILATDISTKALAGAREGIYDPERLRETPSLTVSKYFSVLGSGDAKRYRIKDGPRKLVRFARLNLMGPWPMRGPFDIIFCRNVMIYFDKPTQTRLVSRFWNILASGGVLFIGHSESLTGVQHRFKYVEPTVYEKS